MVISDAYSLGNRGAYHDDEKKQQRQTRFSEVIWVQ
jgi:hypothetical protein